jgi:hypothetical protein
MGSLPARRGDAMTLAVVWQPPRRGLGGVRADRCRAQVGTNSAAPPLFRNSAAPTTGRGPGRVRRGVWGEPLDTRPTLCPPPRGK